MELKDFQDVFSDCSPATEEEFNASKFNKLLLDIYNYAIKPVKDDIPLSVAMSSILPFLGRIISLYRVKLYIPQEKLKAQLNCFSIVLMTSGGGKGTTKSILSRCLLGKYFEVYKSKAEAAKTNLEIELVADKNRHQILKKFILVDDLSDATLAGLRNLYSKYQECHNKFGGAFFYAGEFANYLSNSDAHKKEFLAAIEELYDLGHMGGKLKADDVFKAIDDFPVNALMVTSAEKLLTGEGSKKMNEILEGGYSRRSLFCFPSKQELDDLYNSNDYNFIKNDIRAFYEAKYLKTSKFEKEYSDLVLKIEATLKNLERVTEVCFSSDSHFLYSMYKEYCSLRSDLELDNNLKIEIKNRYWKVAKIAGILHLFSHNAESLIIDEKSFKDAVYIVEYFGKHLERFVETNVKTEAGIIFDVFFKSRNKFIKKSDLNRQKKINDIKGNFSFDELFKRNIDMVQEIAEGKQFDLIARKFGKNKNGTEYCLYDTLKYQYNSESQKLSKILKTGSEKFVDDAL